jgi:tetratricopeptide (TPR) repeat protein
MVLSNLTLANQELGQWSDATKAIASSLELLQSVPDTPDRRRILAQALNTQGSLQLAQGKTEEALTSLQKATEAYKQVGDEAGVIRSLLNQAQALRVMGLYRRALTTLTEVNQTLQGQPDSPLKAAGLRQLGNALRLVGNLNESQEALQQSLAIAEKLPSPPDISAALLSLGNTLRLQQKTDDALKFYQKAAEITGSPTTRIQAQVNQLSLIVDGGVKSSLWSLAQPLLPQIQAQLADLPPSRIAVSARINFAQSLLKMEEAGRKREDKTSASSIPLEPSRFQEIAQIQGTAIQQAKSLGDPRSQGLCAR